MRKIILTTLIVFIFFSGVFPLVQQAPRVVALEVNTDEVEGVSEEAQQKSIDETIAKNQNRIDELQKKDFAGTLSPEEAKELQRLTKGKKLSEEFKEKKDRIERTTGAECDSNVFYCALVGAAEWVMSLFAVIPVSITSFFVYITGNVLDIAVSEMVVNFSKYFNDPDTSITQTWSVLRDLANIFFIFGLLTIAISTILGLDNYGYKKLLPTIVIVALLINFSLFFTKFIIDVSNVFALQFYNGIGSTGISSIFMNQLGIASFHDTLTVLNKYKDIASIDGGIGLLISYATLTSVFFMITAFVFIFTAIMLITRAVGFILLAILSPLAFAAYTLPSTKKLSDQWFEKLWQYAIFAPVLFMLFWVTTKVMPGISHSIGAQGGFLDVFSNDINSRTGAVGLIINFMILITLMLASVIISNKLSIAGGKMATSLAGKATFGTLGAMGRNFPGRGFSRLSQSEKLKEAASKKGVGGIAARLALRTTRAGAKASYDFRAAPGVKTAAKEFGINDLGKPQKGGYEAVLKKQIKDKDDFKKSLAPNTTEEANKQAELEGGLTLTRDQLDIIKKEKEAAELELETAQLQHENAKRAFGEDSFEALSQEKNMQDVKKTVDNLTSRMETKDAEIKETETKIKDVKGQITEKGEVGKQRVAAYANTLATERTFDTLFMKVPRKNKEAAVAVRKNKSKAQQYADLGKELAEEKFKKDESKKTEEKEESKPKDK